MISLEEAKQRLFASIKTPTTERVPLTHALGRICAAPISSLIDLPAFDNSAMDGYAVRADDLRTATESHPVALKLIGRIGAGETFGGTVSPGTCLRLFTGSVVPQGADAVIMQEDVHAENGTAKFHESAKPFENIRLRGEDIRTGTQIVAPGDHLNATRLALLAATGHSELSVTAQPRIALLATGDELVEPGQPLAPGKIYESNRLLLASLLHSLHLHPTILPLVPDTLEATTSTLQSAFAQHDVVITTGGVSVGEFDFVKDAFTKIGGLIDHWKVALRPGKPFVFGRLESSSKETSESQLGGTRLPPSESKVGGTRLLPSFLGERDFAVGPGVEPGQYPNQSSLSSTTKSEGESSSPPQNEHPRTAPNQKFLFGLPGNPVSALVTFLVLVRPALLKMMAARDCELPTAPAQLTAPISNPGDRRHFVRCQFKNGAATPLGRQASHLLGTLGQANSLIDVPPATRLESTTPVTAHLFSL